ncbi:hypothetical protein ACFX13_023393 [Malus domestica]
MWAKRRRTSQSPPTWIGRCSSPGAPSLTLCWWLSKPEASSAALSSFFPSCWSSSLTSSSLKSSAFRFLSSSSSPVSKFTASSSPPGWSRKSPSSDPYGLSNSTTEVKVFAHWIRSYMPPHC